MRRDLRRVPWHLRYRTAAKLASEGRKLATRATHMHTDVRFGPHCRVGPGFTLDIPRNGTFHAGLGVDFRRGFVCEIADDGVVDIGDLCIFTNNMLIQVSTSLRIGRGCIFSQSSLIVDGNHRFRDHTKHVLSQGYDFRPITIGEGASILAKCSIMADVGPGAVIGAGSVVTKPIPAFCVAVGAPARVIEYFGPPDERPEVLDHLGTR